MEGAASEDVAGELGAPCPPGAEIMHALHADLAVYCIQIHVHHLTIVFVDDLMDNLEHNEMVPVEALLLEEYDIPLNL